MFHFRKQPTEAEQMRSLCTSLVAAFAGRLDAVEGQLAANEQRVLELQRQVAAVPGKIDRACLQGAFELLGDAYRQIGLLQQQAADSAEPEAPHPAAAFGEAYAKLSERARV